MQAPEQAREETGGAAPRRSAAVLRWSTVRGSMHNLFVSPRLAASELSKRRREGAKRTSSRAVYDDRFRAAMGASRSTAQDAQREAVAVAEEDEEEEEEDDDDDEEEVTSRVKGVPPLAMLAAGGAAAASRAVNGVGVDAAAGSVGVAEVAAGAATAATATGGGAGDEERSAPRGGGGITRGVLGSILPPGIKRGDIDRLMRRFGAPVDPGCAAENKLRWVDAQKRRWRRGVQKRALAKCEKEARAAAGEWSPFHDLGTNGEWTTYFVNSRTLERRAAPPHSPLSDVDGGGGIELKPLRRGGDRSESSRPDSPAGPGRGRGPGGRGPNGPVPAPEVASHGAAEYVMDIEGFARLQQYLENQRMKIAIVTTLVIIVYFMYMRVTRSLLEIFSTVSINGRRYLAKSLNLEADTAQHKGLMIAAAFFVVGWTVTMPIIGFGALTWMHRTGRGSDPRWRTAIGFLCDGYKREYFWWEAVVLLRKLTILTVAEIIAPDDGFLQAFLAVAVMSIAMVVQAWVQVRHRAHLLFSLFFSHEFSFFFSRLRSSEKLPALRRRYPNAPPRYR